MGWRIGGLIRVKGQDVFYFFITSTLTLGPTLPPVHWLLGFPSGKGATV